MTNRFLMSVAAAAIIAGAGLAHAQGTGPGVGSSGGAAMQGSPSSGGSSAAPSERGAPPAAAPMNRNDATESRGSESGMKSSQSSDKMAPGGKNQRAQDSAQDQKSGTNPEGRGNGDGNARNADSKSGDNRASTTTGQAGAGAKLSGEQRSKITSVIRNQHVQPQTNINFSISVGTRVPRDVRFHPLPADIITLYPDWRGYEFFLVNEQIIVVDPRTLEIVAVLEA